MLTYLLGEFVSSIAVGIRPMSGDLFSDQETRPRLISDLQPNQSGDVFALLASKEQAKTRNDKPYYRVQFRDSRRTVTAMIWSDAAHFVDCDENWKEGDFYKLRGRYFENDYGQQFEIEKIRPLESNDYDEGFDESDFLPASRFSVDAMWDELAGHVKSITEEPLKQLVLAIFEKFGDTLRTHPAASRNHHAYRSGYLEHTLSVVRTAVYLADKYRDYYTEMTPELSKDLVIAGAVLHDVGKVYELSATPSGGKYTAAGKLVGHILLGRDIVRDTAVGIEGLSPETLLRLEHIIISHQNLPEWGSPIAPHTPEALLVHYADEIDAKFHMFATQLEEPMPDGEEFTSRQNAMRRAIFRGLND